jgi:hypothetical protein
VIGLGLLALGVYLIASSYRRADRLALPPEDYTLAKREAHHQTNDVRSLYEWTIEERRAELGAELSSLRAQERRPVGLGKLLRHMASRRYWWRDPLVAHVCAWRGIEVRVCPFCMTSHPIDRTCPFCHLPSDAAERMEQRAKTYRSHFNA